MKNLIELQKKHDEEMACAILENKLNEIYEKDGIQVYVFFISKLNRLFHVGAISLPNEDGHVFINIKDAGRLIRELAPTKKVEMLDLNNDYSVLICKFGEESFVGISWIHGDMNWKVNIRTSELSDVLSPDDSGVIWDTEKINRIVEYVKR